MKIALCFIISYEHILNKEDIWRQWIEPNKDIINVYFYYKDIKKIKSQWILQHALPRQHIHETSYYHVIPAYLSLMQYALSHDKNNQWLCLLTDSCCPIISPRKFRSLFYEYWNKSVISWKPAWWNINIYKRANLALLPDEFHLGNDPWFVLKRENATHILLFSKNQTQLVKTICAGGLANESLFAIILHGYKQLNSSNNNVISGVTHLADWSRMSSATSPHTFKDANATDIKFIEDNLEKNKYAMFIRKVAPEFPNEVLNYYIYEHKYEQLFACEPFIFIYRRLITRLWYGLFIICILYGLKYIFIY